MNKFLLICILSILFFIPSCKSQSTTPSNPVPMINSFTIFPTSIYQGETATLSWSVSKAKSVEIDQGIGVVALTGNLVVNPDRKTIYTLIATNLFGSSTANITLLVKWNLSGNWNGTTTTPSAGTNGIVFTIIQSGSNLSGTWSSSLGYGGDLTGTVSDDSVSANLTSGLFYQATVNGTISEDGKHIDGTGTDNNGSIIFTVEKQ